jgi:PAS domain-containing protein
MNLDQCPSSAQVKWRPHAEAEYPGQIQPLPSATEALQVVHRLRTHKLQLELQNQALRETGQQLEHRLKRYTDLYDFAPVGYAALAPDGAIQEINLAGAALLGLERAYLINRPLGRFVSADTQPAFKAFLEHALGGMAEASCEVVLALDGEPSRPVRLEGMGLVADLPHPGRGAGGRHHQRG